MGSTEDMEVVGGTDGRTGTEGVNMDKEEQDAVEGDSEEEEEEGKQKPWESLAAGSFSRWDLSGRGPRDLPSEK